MLRSATSNAALPIDLNHGAWRAQVGVNRSLGWIQLGTHQANQHFPNRNTINVLNTLNLAGTRELRLKFDDDLHSRTHCTVENATGEDNARPAREPENFANLKSS
jgi:hypothetical protein